MVHVKSGQQQILVYVILLKEQLINGFGIVFSLAIHNIYLQVRVSTIFRVSPCISATLASSDHVARLWHVEQTLPLREYQGHTKAVTAIAYSDK